MLVLSRKTSEQIRIGDDITITVIRVAGNRVRLGIDAPAEIAVRRAELDGPSPSPLDRPTRAVSLTDRDQLSDDLVMN
jgi:carbon storage regulator